eukprot:1183561-Prorocentrum_minimum.AAC.1
MFQDGLMAIGKTGAPLGHRENIPTRPASDWSILRIYPPVCSRMAWRLEKLEPLWAKFPHQEGDTETVRHREQCTVLMKQPEVPMKRHFELVDAEIHDMRELLRPLIQALLNKVNGLRDELLYINVDDELRQ